MSKNFNSSKLFKWVVAIVIPMLIMLIPVDDLFTETTRMFLSTTVFAIVLYAFELLPAMLVGLLLPVSWVLTGCATWAQAMSGWDQDIVVLLMSAFIFTAALERTGVLFRIGYKVIILCGGSFKRTVWGLFIASNIITFMTMGNGMALLGAMGLTVYTAFKLTTEDKETIPIMAAVVLGGLHSVAYCYSPAQVALITGSVRNYNPDFNLTWMQLMCHNMPLLIFGIVCLWIILKWYDKKKSNGIVLNDNAGREYFISELNKMGKMKTDEKKALALLVLLLIGLVVAPSIDLSLAIVFFTATVALYMPFIEIGTEEDIKKSLSLLPTLVVVFAFFAIGTVGTAAGFAKFFVAKLVPIMQTLGPIGSIYAALGIGTASNFVLTPMAMAVLLPGPMVSFCMELGYNYLPHIYAVYVTEHAIFHPYEWPAYLMIFAFGFIKMNDYIKLCIAKTILFLIFVCIFMVPWWLFITG